MACFVNNNYLRHYCGWFTVFTKSSICIFTFFLIGAVSYTSIDKNGRVKRDALFCYDIELPSSFIPKPMDGEVESFELQPLSWVLKKIVEGGPNGYKPNCNIVIIDFLIR